MFPHHTGRCQKVHFTGQTAQFRKDMFTGNSNLKVKFQIFSQIFNHGQVIKCTCNLEQFPQTCFCYLFVISFLNFFFLLLKNNIGGWSWWATSDTTGLQCKRWSLSNAGGYWRNYSSGSYEGKRQPSVPFPPLGQVHSFEHFPNLCWPFLFSSFSVHLTLACVTELNAT